MRGVINIQHLRGGEKEFIGCHQLADDSLCNCYLFLWLDIPVIKGPIVCYPLVSLWCQAGNYKGLPFLEALSLPGPLNKQMLGLITRIRTQEIITGGDTEGLLPAPCHQGAMDNPAK